MKSKGTGKREIGYFFWFAAVVLVAALAVLLIFPVYREYRSSRRELAEREARRSELREELGEKLSEVNALENTSEAVEKVAREKYNLVRQGETVLTYPTPRKAGKEE